MARKKTKTKTKSKTTKQSKKISWVLSKQQKIVLGSFLFLLGLALLFSFISYFFSWQADQSTLSELSDRSVESQNWLNKFGAALGDVFIYQGFGLAAFTLAILVTLSGFYYFFDKPRKKLQGFWFWGIIVMLWFATFLGFFAETNPLLGGMVGFELNDFLQDFIGLIGTILVLAFVAIVYFAIRLKLTPEHIGQFFAKRKQAIASEFNRSDDEGNEFVDTAFDKDNIELPQEEVEETPEEPQLKTTPTPTETPVKQETETKETPKATEDDDFEIEIEETVEEEEVVENLSTKLVQDFGEFDPTLELSNYRFPTIELLKDYTKGQSITVDQEELEENKNRIVDTLKNYKIDIAHIKATVGPTVTLYEIVPEAGVRISKIKNLEDDIALSLAALGIRIIAPIPGKGTIGIEVPNKNARIVSMRSAIASPKFQNAEMELPLTLGKTISNETFVVDLAKMPHLLMAGATGQGKSVGLNAILTSLLYKKHPAEVKFVLVDPKKVELTLFNKIERHYLAKLPDSEDAIITDNTKVINTLNSLCIEMDKRYDLLKDAMARNIKEYNAKFKKRKLNPNDGHKFLPYIVLVIDEFADLIMTAGKEVETPIARLAQLARAIGIHLIVATQRPSVNVITGIIKANFPARIAFRVTSKIDSRTILDSQGADQLIGRGDMLYTQGNNLIRVQCAFVDTPEVEKITDFIGAQKAYPEAHQLPEYVGEEGGTSLDIDASDRDALFMDAAEVIVTAQQGSASLLQRKLKLGYNRAGRIIDQLEAAGIVGPFEGSKARQVLVADMNALHQQLNNE
ncbi:MULTISPECIES: FtsK/SpoIIIE family DNA translocase [Leeuwenhoekiella]|jgi:S-DNA-T family DNA segregation ATPase FtsK/SpoIIIE|uniref:FtsK/SpoIIIE family DNA translocase n=2 Tax=Flavobacteriaceae TaxID=49546 RepID=UPI000C35E6C5|nr:MULTISPECIES: DNA translocase FtsK [Leeuwenhoekiella]MAO45436.1 cell division protein FtsK [Leeuwenhoekiella sp.]MBQ51586.1 cell division protein FtsK [Leeuwenhoekiella sp.]|tara:strand:- start:2872 stop:5265 length:2394 start_codon:yes stop_codon:yes gene_type:complete